MVLVALKPLVEESPVDDVEIVHVNELLDLDSWRALDLDEPYTTVVCPFFEYKEDPLWNEEEYEQEPTTVINPLFTSNEETNFIFAYGQSENDLQDFITRLKVQVLKGSLQFGHTLYEECVLGEDIIEFILTSAKHHFTTEDAIVFAQKYLMRFLIPIPYYIESVIKFNESGIYRFLDDDAPRYYHDNVVNVIKRAAKVKRIDPKEAAKRKTTFLQSMQNINANLKRSMTLEGTILGGSAPEELISNAVLMKRNADINRKSADEISRGSGESLPDIVDDHPSPRFLGLPEQGIPNHEREVIIVMEKIIRALCTPAYINHKRRQFDYKSFADSEIFAEMVMLSGQLRNFDLTVFPDMRPVLVNIHNIMILQALLIRGCPDNETARFNFLQQDLFFIGPMKFSPMDIQHLLLNRPDLIPDYKYYLRQYACKNADPRVVFLLHTGTMGSPLPYAVSIATFERDLDVFTSSYVLNHFEIDKATKTLRLPWQLQTFRHLFSPTFAGIFDFVKSNLPTKKKNELNEFVESVGDQPFDIEFFPKLYKSNRKVAEDIIHPTATQQQVASSGVNPVIFEEEGTLSFHEVKEDEYYREYFKKFCKQEYSIENVLFWEQCREYSFVDRASRRQKALDIYNLFLTADSELEVNVTRALTQRLEKSLFKKEFTDNNSQFMARYNTKRRSFFSDTAYYNMDTSVLSPKNTPPSPSVFPMDVDSVITTDSPRTPNDTEFPDTPVPMEEDDLPSNLYEFLELEIEIVLQDTFSRFVLSEMYKSMIDEVKEAIAYIPPSQSSVQAFGSVGELIAVTKRLSTLSRGGSYRDKVYKPYESAVIPRDDKPATPTSEPIVVDATLVPDHEIDGVISEPTEEPVSEPTEEPKEPVEPTEEPVVEPTEEPTEEPKEPVEQPKEPIVEQPVVEPVAEPVVEPVAEPKPVEEPIEPVVEQPIVEPQPEPVQVAEPVPPTEPVVETPNTVQEPTNHVDITPTDKSHDDITLVEPSEVSRKQSVKDLLKKFDQLASKVDNDLTPPGLTPRASPRITPTPSPRVTPLPLETNSKDLARRNSFNGELDNEHFDVEPLGSGSQTSRIRTQKKIGSSIAERMKAFQNEPAPTTPFKKNVTIKSKEQK